MKQISSWKTATKINILMKKKNSENFVIRKIIFDDKEDIFKVQNHKKV